MFTGSELPITYVLVKKINFFNPFKASVLFVWTKTNSEDSDQMPQNVASDQGLHCLLKVSSIKNFD